MKEELKLLREILKILKKQTVECGFPKSFENPEGIEPKTILLTNEQRNKLINNCKFLWGQKPNKIVPLIPTLFDGYLLRAIYPQPIYKIENTT